MFKFFYIVLAIAANKSDLYDYEDVVSEEEGRSFAKQVNAIFLETSAKSSIGIDVNIKLFRIYLIMLD